MQLTQGKREGQKSKTRASGQPKWDAKGGKWDRQGPSRMLGKVTLTGKKPLCPPEPSGQLNICAGELKALGGWPSRRRLN